MIGAIGYMLIGILFILLGILFSYLFFYFMDEDCPGFALFFIILASLSFTFALSSPIDEITTKYYITEEMKNNENVATLENNCDEYIMKYIENNELKTIDEYKSDTKIYFDTEKPYIELKRTKTILFTRIYISLHFQTQEQMEQLIGNE